MNDNSRPAYPTVIEILFPGLGNRILEQLVVVLLKQGAESVESMYFSVQSLFWLLFAMLEIHENPDVRYRIIVSFPKAKYYTQGHTFVSEKHSTSTAFRLPFYNV